MMRWLFWRRKDQKPKWVPSIGDRVRFQFDDWEPYYDGCAVGSRLLFAREGTIVEATCDGRHVHVSYDEVSRVHKECGPRLLWVLAKDVQLIQSLTPSPVVDARVLQEVAALQRAVGNTEAMIDLLQSVRAPYETGKEDAS